VRKDCTVGKLSKCNEVKDEVKDPQMELELHVQVRNGWSPYKDHLIWDHIILHDSNQLIDTDGLRDTGS
jgi:hypothetical protein